MRLKILVLALLLSGVAFAQGRGFLQLNVIPKGDLTQVTTTTSAAVDLRNFDNIGLQENVAATSATGEFFFDISNDYTTTAGGAPANPGNWVTLPITSMAVTGAGVAVVTYRDINQTGAAYGRIRYVPTSNAAGSFSVYVTAKPE